MKIKVHENQALLVFKVDFKKAYEHVEKDLQIILWRVKALAMDDVGL